MHGKYLSVFQKDTIWRHKKQINNDISDCHLETDALMGVLSMPYGVGIEHCKDVGLRRGLVTK